MLDAASRENRYVPGEAASALEHRVNRTEMTGALAGRHSCTKVHDEVLRPAWAVIYQRENGYLVPRLVRFARSEVGMAERRGCGAAGSVTGSTSCRAPVPHVTFAW